jgi:hypothetical protein
MLIRKPSPEDPGDIMLFITRPPEGLAGGGTVVVACQEVQTGGEVIVAITSYGTVQFPKDTPYLAVPRGLCTPVTTRELARLRLEERNEWDSVFNDGESSEAAATAPIVVATTGPGQYL